MSLSLPTATPASVVPVNNYLSVPVVLWVMIPNLVGRPSLPKALSIMMPNLLEIDFSNTNIGCNVLQHFQEDVHC